MNDQPGFFLKDKKFGRKIFRKNNSYNNSVRFNVLVILIILLSHRNATDESAMMKHGVCSFDSSSLSIHFPQN